MRWIALLCLSLLAIVHPASATAGITTLTSQRGNIDVNPVTGTVILSVLVNGSATVPSGTPSATGTIQLLDSSNAVLANASFFPPGPFTIGGCTLMPYPGAPPDAGYCANLLGAQIFNLSTLVPGSYTLHAVYSGDAYYDPSTSAEFSFVVPPRPSKVATLTSQRGSINVDPVTGTVVLSVLVNGSAAVPAGTPTATGTIQLLNGSNAVVANSSFFPPGPFTIGGCTLMPYPGAPPDADYCANLLGAQIFNLSALAPGSYTLHAAYSGDAYYDPSTSTEFSFVVPPRSSKVATLTSQRGSIEVNPVTGTAVLSILVNGSTPVPTGTPSVSGTIQLLDGSNSVVSSSSLFLPPWPITIGGCTLVPYPGAPPDASYCANLLGVQTFNLSALAPGSYTLHAVYSGDAYYDPSTSTEFSFVVPPRSNKVATLTSQRGSIDVNPVTGTAVLSILVNGSTAVPSGTPSVSGTIQLLDGSNSVVSSSSLFLPPWPITIGGCTLVPYPGAPPDASYCANLLGVQTFNLSALAPGSYTLHAVYSGDAYYDPSTSTEFSFVIPPRSNKVATLTSQRGSIDVDPITGTAVLSILVNGSTQIPSGTPSVSGTIQLLNGSNSVVSSSSLFLPPWPITIGGCTLAPYPGAPPDASYCANLLGVQTFNLSTLAPGSYTLHAVYSGDAYYDPSTSAEFSFVVPDRTPVNPPLTSFNGPTATRSGNVTVSMSGGGGSCGFTSDSFVPVNGGAGSPSVPPPASANFEHGLIRFQTSGCIPGSTVTFTFNFPSSARPIQAYWKFGRTSTNTTPHWYQIPVVVTGTQVQFSITDGGLGDDDMTANGTISDPGGPVLAAPAVSTAVEPTPVLGRFELAFLAALLLIVGQRILAARTHSHR